MSETHLRARHNRRGPPVSIPGNGQDHTPVTDPTHWKPIESDWPVSARIDPAAGGKSTDGLPADYISAASLWQETFSRYWLVERLIERGRVYELFGRYKGGKTLVAIDMVCSLAADLPQWAGRRTGKAFVIWIAGEAVDDVKQRMAAWLRHHDVRHEIPLYIRTKPAHMNKEEFAVQVGQEVRRIQRRHPDRFPLLVIDTVARNLSPGCDENSPQGLGAFVNNLIDHVVRPNNAAALCVHHPGHSDADRGRGHSSFPGAVDGIIKVTMDKSNGIGIITVSTMDARNTAGDDSFSFRIETQEIPGEDNFGNPIDAPVLQHLADYVPPQKPSGYECQAVEILQQMLEDSDEQPPSVAVINWKAAFKEWYHSEKPDADTKSSTQAWRRTEKGLHKKNIIAYAGYNNTRVAFRAPSNGVKASNGFNDAL